MGILCTSYDLRGEIGEDLDETWMRRLGVTFSGVLSADLVVVGHDLEPGCRALAEALVQGLGQGGAPVMLVGECSTPLLVFAIHAQRAGAGVMVTGGRVPQRVAIKVFGAEGMPLGREDGLAEIVSQLGQALPDAGAQGGQIETTDLSMPYIAELMKYADEVGVHTVVADAGGRVMGGLLPKLFAKLPCELIGVNFDPRDGEFDLPPAFSDEALGILRRKVEETRADVGIAFDADGSRCRFLDHMGEPVSADALSALLAEYLLEAYPAAAVGVDVRSSRVVREVVEAAGGRVVVCPVAPAALQAVLREQDAVFLGEPDGHYSFRDLKFACNPEMAMLSVLSVMNRKKKSLRDLTAPYGKYVREDFSIPCEHSTEALACLAESVAGEAMSVIYVDGVSADLGDVWFNVRPSGVEPVLRVSIEGRRRTSCQELSTRIRLILAGDDGPE